MKKNKILFLIFFFSPVAFSWSHEIGVGYAPYKTAISFQPTRVNSGAEIFAKIVRFPKIDNTLIFTIDATVAHWRCSSTQHNKTTIFVIAPSARAYFFNFAAHRVRPYLGLSFGPAYLTARQLGTRKQGANVAFQTQFGIGMEMGSQQHSVDFNIHMAHYCNAGLFSPNDGFNVLPIFQIGYQFE